MSNILTFVISVLVIFLAGVGVGSLVLATRIQNAVKRGIAAARAEEQKAVVWTKEEWEATFGPPKAIAHDVVQGVEDTTTNIKKEL